MSDQATGVLVTADIVINILPGDHPNLSSLSPVPASIEEIPYLQRDRAD